MFNGTFTGFNNVGLGRNVMSFLTSGRDNSALGDGALLDVTSGSHNIANGFQALLLATEVRGLQREVRAGG